MSSCLDEPWLIESREPKTLRDGFGNVVFVDDVLWITHYRTGGATNTLFGIPVIRMVADAIGVKIEKAADRKTAAMKRRWKSFR